MAYPVWRIEAVDYAEAVVGGGIVPGEVSNGEGLDDPDRSSFTRG